MFLVGYQSEIKPFFKYALIIYFEALIKLLATYSNSQSPESALISYI